MKYAFRKPVQDLAGVQTWVSKTRQDGIQNDTSAPEKSRADYQDGKPQRDRVLPLPSGHPEGRDEAREGFGGFFTPPHSEGALGKPLHEKPRSSAVPGDEYGHPYLDGKDTTGIARRTLTSSEEGERVAVPRADISLKPPRPRQREQKGTIKRKRRLKYLRTKRKNRSAQKNKARRWYQRNKHRVKRRMSLYRDRLSRHKRHTGGGVSTTKQKNERGEERRKEAFMKREAVKDVLSAMYRQIDVDHFHHIDFEDSEGRLGEEMLAIPKRGPGSRSTRRQVRQRARRRKRNPASMKRQRRLNRLYYRKNKSKIKRKVKKWRNKFKSKIKRWNKNRKYASSYFTLPSPLPCMVDGHRFMVVSLSPCTRHAIFRNDLGQWSLPLKEFYYSSDWDNERDENVFDDFIQGVALSMKGGFSRRASTTTDPLSILQLLLAGLRGAHWAHLTSHWQVKGENSYGDHLLMERIYSGLTEEIDGLAEKMVAMYGPRAVEPVSQAQLMANSLLPTTEAISQSDPIKRALIVEEALQIVFKKTYDSLKEMGVLSLGMDDFIMSMASAHETNQYLLRQRSR